MKRLIKHKVFIGAFLTAYFLFSILFSVMTTSIFDWQKSGIILGLTEYGFPFTYYYSGCFSSDYLWLGLAGNILTAAIFSFAVGLTAAYFRLKFSSPAFRAKWHI
jgi:hypothetical protein